MEPLIRLENVRYRYSGGQWLLRDIDFSIDPGEYLAICGANGSGKSTIGYLFNGLIPHFFDGELQGRVTVEGLDTRTHGVAELFSRVGLVLQNAEAQLFNSDVAAEIAFGLESLGLSARKIDRRIAETVEILDIKHLLHRTPMTLSGGEKRLVAIASVLCLEPAVIVLDEPYANLDWTGVERVRTALKALHRRGNTVVVIEQRMDGFLDDIDRCLIVEQGRIRFDTEPRQARGLLSAEKLIPRYASRRRNSGSPDSPVLLEVDGLSCRMGAKQVLDNVSFQLLRGETVALVGKNGAGKTTLVRHLNGLSRAAEGEVLFDGNPLGKKSPRKLATDVGISFQNPNDQFFKNRVRDELTVGLNLLKNGRSEWFGELCRTFDLEAVLDRPPYRLSEGQKKRVALASILTMRPGLLVLDEPTVGQDGRGRETLAARPAGIGRRGFHHPHRDPRPRFRPGNSPAVARFGKRPD